MHTHKRKFIESIKKLSAENATVVMSELMSLLKPYSKKDPKLHALLDEVAEAVLKEMRLL
jgi:hypothetical protein